MNTRHWLSGLLLAGWAAMASATCPETTTTLQLTEHYLTARPLPDLPAMTLQEAACSRDLLIRHASQQLGSPIGYKIALTNAAVQARFNASEPVWGFLLEGMLLANHARVPLNYAARPVFEADLLVRVKSASIAQAATPTEVLAALDQVIPFIELADLVVESPASLDATGILAINAGARLGVAGTPLAIPEDPSAQASLLQELTDMRVELTDDAGQLLASGQGRDLLEHPLNAVIWLNTALQSEGLGLQPGDLVSLGAFTSPTPPRAGTGLTLRYHGLTAASPVQLEFVEP